MDFFIVWIIYKPFQAFKKIDHNAKIKVFTF